jgi:hypothetical protein
MHRRAIWTGCIGFLLVVTYAVVGAFQVLVWNPMAAVHGATLEEIRADMERANESLAAPLVSAWAITGTLLAAAVLIAAMRPSVSVKTIIVLNLLLLVLGAPSLWFVSFPAGMGIADTFATTGGDHAPWGSALYIVSAMALVALIFIVIRRKGKATTRSSSLPPEVDSASA